MPSDPMDELRAAMRGELRAIYSQPCRQHHSADHQLAAPRPRGPREVVPAPGPGRVGGEAGEARR